MSVIRTPIALLALLLCQGCLITDVTYNPIRRYAHRPQLQEAAKLSYLSKDESHLLIPFDLNRFNRRRLTNDEREMLGYAKGYFDVELSAEARAGIADRLRAIRVFYLDYGPNEAGLEAAFGGAGSTPEGMLGRATTIESIEGSQWTPVAMDPATRLEIFEPVDHTFVGILGYMLVPITVALDIGTLPLQILCYNAAQSEVPRAFSD